MATTLTPLETNSATLAKVVYLLDSTDLRVFPGDVKQDMKDVKAVLLDTIKVLDILNEERVAKAAAIEERRLAREAKAKAAASKKVNAPKATESMSGLAKAMKEVSVKAPAVKRAPRAKKAAPASTAALV